MSRLDYHIRYSVEGLRISTIHHGARVIRHLPIFVYLFPLMPKDSVCQQFFRKKDAYEFHYQSKIA